MNLSQQLFLRAIVEGKTKPEAWAARTREILVDHCQHLLKDGKPIESAEENLAETKQKVVAFADKDPRILALVVA